MAPKTHRQSTVADAESLNSVTPLAESIVTEPAGTVAISQDQFNGIMAAYEEKSRQQTATANVAMADAPVNPAPAVGPCCQPDQSPLRTAIPPKARQTGQIQGTFQV